MKTIMDELETILKLQQEESFNLSAISAHAGGPIKMLLLGAGLATSDILTIEDAQSNVHNNLAYEIFLRIKSLSKKMLEYLANSDIVELIGYSHSGLSILVSIPPKE